MKESTLDRMTPGNWHYSSGMVWAGQPEEIPVIEANRDTEKTRPTERDANARACSYVPEMIQALMAIVNRFDYLAKMEDMGNDFVSVRRMGGNGEIAKARKILAELSKKD